MAVIRTPVVLGNARFTVYTEGCVRLEYAEGGKFSPYASVLVGKKLPRPASADVVKKKSSVRIKTEKFELSYKDDGKIFSPENLRVVHKTDEGKRAVWVPGKEDRGNLATVRRCLDHWKWCGGPEHYPKQGILSRDGGHFVADEARVYWNTKYDWPEALWHRVGFDGFFFAYGEDFKGALKDFVTVFGRIPMVPRWAFGFWYSRWYPYKDREFMALAKRYRREGMPIDVMVIDTEWRAAGWHGYDWNKKYFPKPTKALKDMRTMGLHTSLNDHPGYDNSELMPAGDSHIPKIEKALGGLPHQGQWACDWSNKKAVAAWKKHVLGPFFDQGMDFWWIDGWIKGPFGDMDSQLWANWQYYDLAREKTGKRGMILSRWGGIGSHRYPVQFSGDTPSKWDMLSWQIEFTARSGDLGAIYWSHDIGGFFDHKVDEELYIRWCQFGAMSPIFRTHSSRGLREPWEYSARAKAIFRKQTRIRAALAPYFYTLAREAYDTGLPIVRPLYLEYNGGDGGALYRKNQYTIGRDLLVIPADNTVDPATKMQRKRAYFPEGGWYGLETNEVIRWLEDRSIDIPLERIPTYVRYGAIIPCQPVTDRVGTRPPAEIEFNYFPDPLRPSAYTLYEDDGESMGYEKKERATIKVTGRRTASRVFLSIGGPKGSYRGMPRKRSYVVRTRVEPNEKVARVEAKVGAGPWQRVRHRVTNLCFAGSVKSGHRFCEAAVESANKPVKVRVIIA